MVQGSSILPSNIPVSFNLSHENLDGHISRTICIQPVTRPSQQNQQTLPGKPSVRSMMTCRNIIDFFFSSDITKTRISYLCLEEMMLRTIKLQKTTCTVDVVGKKSALILLNLVEGWLAVSQRKVVFVGGGLGDDQCNLWKN